MGTIYKITNKINGKCYIGQAQDVKTRFSNHRANAFCKNSNNIPKLYNAFRKYGLDNFSFYVISNEIENFQLDFWERFYICLYNSIESGYNITPGGNTQLGVKRSQETKDRISKAKQGTLSSEQAREKGKMRKDFNMKQSTKDKISKALTNRIVTQETKDNMSAGGTEYTYYLKDPTGNPHITTNMKKFVKDFGLDKSHMLKVCDGKEKQHKGWTCTERIKLEK